MRWTDRAVRDLSGIYDYVSGRVIRRFARAGVREIIVRPYRIAYRVAGDEVHILKVHHGARLLHRRDIEED